MKFVFPLSLSWFLNEIYESNASRGKNRTTISLQVGKLCSRGPERITQSDDVHISVYFRPRSWGTFRGSPRQTVKNSISNYTRDPRKLLRICIYKPKTVIIVYIFAWES